VRKVVDLIISSKDVISRPTVISISLCTHSTGIEGMSFPAIPNSLLLSVLGLICLSDHVA
jgi:hypothetical protein